MLRHTKKEFCISKPKCPVQLPVKKDLYIAKIIKEENYPKPNEECPPLQETCIWETNYLKKKPLVCYPYSIKK